MQNLECNSIEEVRENIDSIDKQIVSLIAQRGGLVKQAAKFKNSTQDVKAPARVEQVIAKVVSLADEFNGDKVVFEKVYRAMIDAFINSEMEEFEHLKKSLFDVKNNQENIKKAKTNNY